MRSVLLTVHLERPEATRFAAVLAGELQAADIEVRALRDERPAIESHGVSGLVEVVAGPGAVDGCELAIVFGGDGTILRTTELCRGTGAAVLGVNLGHVGFLAEADREDVEHIAARVIAGDFIVEERLTIDATVTVAGEVVARGWALNEATVEKAARGRMIEVVAEIDGRPVSMWGCDGVVCATPTGSTAYSFSAGGPIVWPDVAALLMVPISAHALFARPLVVSPSSGLAIEILGRSLPGVLSCDGRRSIKLAPGSRVEIRRGAESVRLARLHTPPPPFADRLVNKFELPVTGWRGAADRRREAGD